MTSPTLAVAFSLATTVPVAAMGWIAGSLVERMTAAPILRAWTWRGVVGLDVAAALAVPVWLTPAPAAASHGASLAAVTVINLAAAGLAAPAAQGFSLLAPTATALTAAIGLGALAQLIRLVLTYRRGARLAGAATPLAEGRLPGFTALAHRLGVRPPPVLVSDHTATAVLVGLFRPVIVLPARLSDALDDDGLAAVCAHELAHLQRGDNWRVMADRVLQSIFWFNPFVAQSINRLAAVREEFCDAVALAGADQEHRRRYAATLIEALRLSAGPAQQPAFIRRKGPGYAMRLNAILHPAKRPSKTVVTGAAGLLCAAAASSFFVSAGFAQALGSASMASPPQVASQQSASQSPTKGAFDIMADKVASKGRMVIYEGSPSIKGEVTANVPVEIDGSPLPVGFYLNGMSISQIDRIEITFTDVVHLLHPSPNKPRLINIITKQG